jgi:hypothetical protein
MSQTPAFAVRNTYVALYVNDDIKFSRLTINAGLRWDYEQPRTERYDRFSTFDFNAPFPVQVNGLSNLQGVLTHPGQNGEPRGQFDSYYKAFGPRIGISYSLDPKTVIRSGYGIFYSPRFGTTSATNFGGAGATLSSTWVSSLDGVTPLNPMSNPFPNGVFPSSTSVASQVLLGQSLLFMDRGNVSNTYNQQWNFNIQRELPFNILMEAGYAGNAGVHLPIGIDFNQLNPVYQSLGANLTKQVPTPSITSFPPASSHPPRSRKASSCVPIRNTQAFPPAVRRLPKTKVLPATTPSRFVSINASPKASDSWSAIPARKPSTMPPAGYSA